jgi:CBS domain-containing protein
MTCKVVSIDSEASILQAVRLMLQNGISGLPVVDDAERVIGIISEGDLLRRAEIATERQRSRWLEFLAGPGRLAEDYVRAHARKVHEVMTNKVATISEDTPLDEIVHLMERRRIKRLPVTRDQRLVGIVTRANHIRALAVMAREAAPGPADDAQIRTRILAELERQPWARMVGQDVLVRKGVIDFWGVVSDEKQREAVTVLAENIPGVKEVRNHLVWVEPMSGMVLGPIEENGALAKAGKQS